MSKITYKESISSHAYAERVYLDGKLVGYIRKDNGGYYYEPMGKGARGLSMGSTYAVHKSLED